MKVLFLITVLSLNAFSMTPEAAYNLVHGVLVQIPMKSDDHDKADQALKVLKDLAAKESARLAKEEKAKADAKVIEEYLKEKDKK